MTRLTRTMSTIGLLGLCYLAIGPAVWAADVRPAAPEGPPVTIDYNNLLNGRYSFRFQGEDSFSDVGGPVPFSVIGSVVFDGQGNVESMKFFRTKDGSTARWGRSTDDLRFVSGTYSVNNTEIGHVDVHFKANDEAGTDFNLNWDIALTNGGKGFYINVHSMVIDNDVNGRWTANGQAAPE